MGLVSRVKASRPLMSELMAYPRSQKNCLVALLFPGMENPLKIAEYI